MVAEKLGFGGRCRNGKQDDKREHRPQPLDAPPSDDAVTP
jgi:hypothetical protein